MRQQYDVQVRQGAVNYFHEQPMDPVQRISMPFMSKVVAVYPDRMTCDIQTFDGQTLVNIPVMTRCGLVDGKPYGEIDLPAIDDYVIAFHAGSGSRHIVVLGTIVPYLAKEMLEDVVNSDNKQFTKKLLEGMTDLEYRRVFKSGLTLQVFEDGSVILEQPNGTFLHLDNKNEMVTFEDLHGNIIILDSNGTKVTDTNANNITMSSSGIAVEDANGNMVTMSSSGIEVEDANGNILAMQSGKVVINSNLEVAQ